MSDDKNDLCPDDALDEFVNWFQQHHRRTDIEMLRSLARLRRHYEAKLNDERNDERNLSPYRSLPSRPETLT